jgi:hypothetical protein
MIYKNWDTESQISGIISLEGFLFVLKGLLFYVVYVFAYIKTPCWLGSNTT